MGAFGGNFIDKPAEKNYPDPSGSGQRVPFSPAYPGFGGTTSGFGLALDARLIKLVGLEIDVIRMTNKGHADLDLNGRSYTVEIGHDAWHIPVLLKGVLPLPLFSPMVLVGAEFVRTSSPTAEYTSGQIPISIAANTSNYTLFTAGLGFEIKLPVPAVDIRIPFSLRGSFYPGASDKVEDWIKINQNSNPQFTYDTRWKYQALATLGAQIYF